MRKLVLFLSLIFLFACNDQITRFVEPTADFSLESSTVELFSIVKITNEGSGEFFSVWTGDEGHDYSLKDAGKNNSGFSPNLGRDFNYSYTQSGTFTIVMVSSSFDENTNKYVSVTSSQQIVVKPGNDGNFIEKFALYNVEKDYSPEAKIYGDTALVFILPRKYEPRVNTRPVKFRTNFVKAVLTSEKGDTLYSDFSTMNLYDIDADKPIVNKINVYGYYNKLRVYKVITGFYPEVKSIKFTDGPSSKPLVQVPGTTSTFETSIYRDSFLPLTTTLTYESDADAIVTMDNNPTPIISGVTPITLSQSKHTFYFNKTVYGFKITTSVTMQIVYI